MFFHHWSLVESKKAVQPWSGRPPVCLKLALNMVKSTKFTLTVALPSIDGIAIVTGHAALTLCPRRQVSAVFTHAAVDTPAVTITLTCCQNTHRMND